MAVAYQKEEILSASRVARSFGKVLTDLTAQHRRRVVVLKNNQVEAVIVPVDEYEKMAEALDLLEYMEIHRRNRSGSCTGSSIKRSWSK